MPSVLMSRRRLLLGDGGVEGSVQNLEVVRPGEMGVTGTESCLDGGEFYLSPLKEPEGTPGDVSDTVTALLSLSFLLGVKDGKPLPGTCGSWTR